MTCVNLFQSLFWKRPKEESDLGGGGTRVPWVLGEGPALACLGHSFPQLSLSLDRQTSLTLSFKHFIQFGYKLYLLPQCCLHQKLLILIKSNSLIFDDCFEMSKEIFASPIERYLSFFP